MWARSLTAQALCSDVCVKVCLSACEGLYACAYVRTHRHTSAYACLCP